METRPGGRNEGNGNQLDRDGVIGSGPDKMESFCWWPILRCGVKKADDDDDDIYTKNIYVRCMRLADFLFVSLLNVV